MAQVEPLPLGPARHGDHRAVEVQAQALLDERHAVQAHFYRVWMQMLAIVQPAIQSVG